MLQRVSLLRRFSVAISIYLLFVVILYAFQRHIQYLPSKTNIALSKFSLEGFEEIKLTTKDSLELTSWYKGGDFNKKIILYFHGNGGSLGDRAFRYQEFAKKFNILALSYRGYSGNEGKPTEKGLIYDAMAAYEFLLAEGFQNNDIIIYGESIGSGVAMNLAQNRNFHMLVLESPFYSALSVAKSRYWMFPVRLLMKDKFRSDLWVKNVSSPVLIVHGDEDEVVEINQGRKLYDAVISRKKFVEVKGVGHSNFSDNFMIDEIEKFLK